MSVIMSEGKNVKGGQNPPNTSSLRPAPPSGSKMNHWLHQASIRLTDRSGDIIFTVNNGCEMLRIGGDGNFYVKGNLVTNDRQIYDVMKAFVYSVTP
jgi:hypothetical protein